MKNIHLQFLILIKTINQALIGGVLSTFTPKKNLLLFDSLGLEGFRFFIVDNYKNILDELLYDLKKCKVSLVNQKLAFCTMKFSVNVWEKLPHTKKEQLTDTAQNY